ncbi:adenine nucleotide alpha hydrolases-like protein [Dothidotthia symphoricarpi CBS 119687]|uniref:Adenine nucleotide alpha hydrolases-like protein n=1 Tax=Dothidotthia symphoricarpi CBS 119687 TaxID=1392245 RepID=A0A6A6AML2_9PLEO|nr:adenine nucleotide alpha hydrolases-like protein [Dothidotthia symphoricarpi CBS 119687]KAF2133169.1 adenine nucleotide alpha hydrolases-like protein [Dothidotthia symphoricarpi CBS 119687]
MSTSPKSRGLRYAPPPTRKTGSAMNPLLVPNSGQNEPRRSSIQFLAHRNASLPRGSPKPRERRRLSSPPPPPAFQPRVSFDTFDKPADFIEESSFTLITKHKDYEYTKRSRTFLCGFDENEYSSYALQWLINELVDDGDEIVCLRVVEKEDAIAGDRSVETGRYRTEAETMMRDIQNRNLDNKAINVILEFSIGKVNKIIDDMINLYEPAILVVGTRGKSLGGFQGLLPGSVSKYCLQHSPVPVIVVRPSSKRDKARHKRANDPDRQSYSHMLAKSESLIEIDSPRNNIITGEEAEVAAAPTVVGFKQAVVDRSPLAQVSHAEYSDDERETGANTAGYDLRSPAVLMKSPELQNLDSPDLSEDSSSSDDEGQGSIPTDTAASRPGGLPQMSGFSFDTAETSATEGTGSRKQSGTFLNYG